MEELAERAVPDLVNGLERKVSRATSFLIRRPDSNISRGSTHRRVEIDKDGTRNIFAAAGFREEGFERTTLAKVTSFRVHATVRLQTVLQKVPVSPLKKRLSINSSRLVIGHVGSAVRKSGEEETYSSQALLPSWAPAWPM